MQILNAGVDVRLGAARAVGAILKTNYDPTVPCHRVIRSDGSLGGYNRGASEKQALLDAEREAPYD